MTPTEALAQALHELSREPSEFGGHLCECRSDAASILAALAEHGMTVARTDDARDGEALRLLREALPVQGWTLDVVWNHSTHRQTGGWLAEAWEQRRPGNGGNSGDLRPTIADAADACRKAIEAAR